MKTKALLILTFFVLGFLFIHTSSAQGLLNDHNTWNVLVEELISNDIDTEILHFDGDSALGGYNYKIMQANYYGNGNSFSAGLLREESNRIYYIYPGEDEGLLYDFNLEIGDSAMIICMFKYDDAFKIFVTNIDTAEYYGIERKRWFLEDAFGNEDFWIEGIGSSRGPIHTMVQHFMPPYLTWNLLCYHHNDTLLFMKEGYSNCLITHVDIDEFSLKEDIIIYPNPAYDKITIKNNNESIYEIQILNIQGQLMKKTNKLISSSCIDISGLDKGTYILKLTNEEEIIYKKLIKR